MKDDRRAAPDFQETGFGAFEAIPAPPSGHTHDTFEISVFAGGSVTMRYGGRPINVPPHRLIAHWGMLPHQMVRRDPSARVLGVHIPLTWVLQWPLPGTLLSRLLDLECWIEPRRSRPCGDLALLRDWCRLLREGGPYAAEIVLTEVRARLLRLAQAATAMASTGIDAPAPSSFGRALHYLIRHFRESIRIGDVSAAAGISPRHLTRTFAAYTGQTLNGYVTHLRLSYARRRLMTSDGKVLDIMHEAGFSCATQFYDRFREQSGCTPDRYRHWRLDPNRKEGPHAD